MNNEAKLEVLRDAARRLEEALVDGIISQKLLKTGELGRSVSVRLDEQNQKFIIVMNDYGLYQDTGVSGLKIKQPANPESLYDPGQFRSSVIGGPLPFPVRKSIAQKGFRPRPFIQGSVDKVVEQFMEPLADAGVEDINNEIIQIFIKNGATV